MFFELNRILFMHTVTDKLEFSRYKIITVSFIYEILVLIYCIANMFLKYIVADAWAILLFL